MKKGLVTIELDKYALKVLIGQVGPDGWKVEHLAVRGVSELSDEELVAALKEVLPHKKIKGRQVVMVIPRAAVTVKYLQLPATNPEELQNMVDIQAVRQMPYSPEEMVYDYQVVGPATAEGYTKVLLVIVRKDIITRYLELLAKAGIRPECIELNSLALVELFRFVNGVLKDQESRLPVAVPVALIDVNYATTDIVVVQNGISLFNRAVSIGAMQLADKENTDLVTEWIEEINRSLLVFQRDQGRRLEQVLVLGNCQEKFISLIGDKMGVAVSTWDMGSLITGISLQDAAVSDIGVSVSSLLGVIREGVVTTVNLIPEAVKVAWVTTQKRKSLAFTGIMVAGLLAVAGLTLHKRIQDRKAYLAVLQRRLQETAPPAEELGLRKERLALIKKQLSVAGTSLDVLRELYTIIPQKTSLNVFIYDDKLGVTIKGVSPAMSEVFALIPKLEESPYFENVTSRYATQRKIKGQELTDFHIDWLLSKPGVGPQQQKEKEEEAS